MPHMFADSNTTTTATADARALTTEHVPVPSPQAQLDDAVERGRTLATQISALQAQLAEVAAEVHELAGFYVDLTPRAFLSWQWHLTPAEAARTLRLGRNLGELPLLRDALARGRLSEGVVDLLAKVATAENEATLLATAENATGAQLQALVRDYRRGLPPDERDRRPEAYRERVGDDGMVDVHLRLTPERAASWRASLDAARGRERDDRRAQQAAEADDRRRAAGQPEPTGGATTDETTDDEQPPRVTDIDAVCRLADDHLDTHRRADGSLGDQHQVNVHIDLDDLLDPFSPTAQARIEGTGAVDPRVAAKLACTEKIAFIVERDGQPVTVVNPSRFPNRAQRRAVRSRDKTCRAPGCARTRGCEVHHIVPCEVGGKTVLSNLILLCEQHHTQVHLGRWRIVAHPEAGPRWFDYRGRPVAEQSRRLLAGDDGQLRLPDLGERAVPPHEPLTEFTADSVLLAWHSN